MSEIKSKSNNNNKTQQLIKLNVGGRKFITTNSTLFCLGENFLTRMIENHTSGRIPTLIDDDGAFFIDRDGDSFAYVLDFLRCCGQIQWELLNPFMADKLKRELDFYGISVQKRSDEIIKNEKTFAFIAADAYNMIVERVQGLKHNELPVSFQDWRQSNWLEYPSNANQSRYSTKPLPPPFYLIDLLAYLSKRGWNVLQTSLTSMKDGYPKEYIVLLSK